MKKCISVLVVAFILSPALALATGASPSLNYLGVPDFAAPTVVNSAGLLSDYSIGSILYDSTHNKFFGLDQTGTWQPMSPGSPVAKQIVIGTAQTVDDSITASSFTGFPTNNPTVTFTASNSGEYRIYCLTTISTSIAGANGQVKIANTLGGATVNYASEIYYNNGAGYFASQAVENIVTLVSGTTYTFDLQGKVSTGTLYLNSSRPTNGIAMVAEQLQ